MKATGLMIGDLVCYRGTNIRVTSLYDKGGSNEVGWSDKECVWVNADNVEPIPLTPEILEKNGFVEWRDKCYRWEYAEGVYINADFTEEEPWVHISNRCYSATPVCRYVHEFQHALRLCGIEKEIIL